jgi:hypothetical protein
MANNRGYKKIGLTVSVKPNAKVKRFFNLTNFLTTFNRKMWRCGNLEIWRCGNLEM